MRKYVLLSIFVQIGSLFSQDYLVFQKRRLAVRDQLGPKSAMVLFTANVYSRNRDVDHEFRPDSDFWYLTGHHEPDGILILLGHDFFGSSSIPFRDEIIFTRPRNPRWEVWTGKRLGIEGVTGKLRFQYAEVPDSFAVVFEQLVPFVDTLYVNEQHPSRDSKPAVTLERLDDFSLENVVVLNAGIIIHPMRQVKSANEIALMRKAINITGVGLLEAMMRTKPRLAENNIEATIEFVFRDLGSERLGFPSIVASGANSTILHYTENNRTMESGDLLLMDVGAEYHMYSADITRTIPVNGKFTREQRELYSYVLEAQKTAFDSVKIGMTLKELDRVARDYLTKKGFDRYFIHGLSHWVGLDVHDVGGRDLAIGEGSVFTLEPGIYIGEDDTTAAEHYRGIGIRIEDDVLMTREGPVWLSAQVPKEIGAIERVMRRGQRRIRRQD